MTILGAALVTAISYTVEDFMVARARNPTTELIEMRAQDHLTPEDFKTTTDCRKNANFRRYIEDILTSEVVKIKIYNTEGKIICSNDERLIGKTFKNNPDLQAALKGEKVVEINRNLEKEENIYEQGYRGLMEIYVPILAENGEIVGVVDVYQILDFLDDEIKKAKIIVFSLVTTGLTILYLVLFGIVSQASRTIRFQKEELERSNRQLRQIDRMKSDFMSTIGHELRTPLTSIIGYSKLLLDGNMGELDKEQKEALKEILSGGNNLLRLINDILEFQRVESGKSNLKFEKTRLSPLISQIVRTEKPMADEKNQKIEIQIDPTLQEIVTDPDKLKQILLNLLNNAIKFTPQDGEIKIQVKQENNKVKISITDNGIGIDKKDQEKIFKPFQQLDQGLSRKYQGTGLGLAIVKEYTQRLGGEITLESELGKGSTFTITLPLKKQEDDQKNN